MNEGGEPVYYDPQDHPWLEMTVEETFVTAWTRSRLGGTYLKAIYKKPVVRVPASKKKAYKNLFVKAKIPGGVIIKAG